MSQTPEDQLKSLWQGQKQEMPTMTVAAIRMLVKDNESHIRRALIGAFIVDAVVVAVVLWAAWTAPNTLVRAADLIMLLWAPLVLRYQLRRWPRRAPGAETTARELIDFYRAQIVRQGPDLKLTGLALAPVGVSLVLLLIAIWDKASRMHPSPLWFFAAVIVAWAVGFFHLTRAHRRRTAQRLRDLDALRD